MIEIMYFVHGSTLDNEAHIASGWDQVSLSPKGIEQVRKLAHQIDGGAFDAIYSSDLIRAIESAKIMFPDRQGEMIVDPRLRECDYGDMTKMPNAQLVYQAHIERPFPNGECLRDVEQRVRGFLRDVGARGCMKIAIVGHRAPQLAVEVAAYGILWDEAILNDWRTRGQWQPGWVYRLTDIP